MFKLDQSKNDFAAELKQIIENLDTPNISKKIEKLSKKKDGCLDQYLIALQNLIKK